MAVLKLVEKDGRRIEVRKEKHGKPDPDYELPAVGWRVRVYIGQDPDTGKRKYVTKTRTRKKDADKEARRLEDLKEMGAATAISKEPLSKYLRRWLEQVKKGSLRARTWEDYSGVLRRYIEEPADDAPPIGKIRLDRLTPHAVQELYHYMQEEEGLSPRTVRSLHAVVRQGLAHAARTGAAARNVADLVELPKQDRREVKAMSPEEANRFLEAARADRYYPLWCVLLTGGLRPGEALALRWADLDLDAAKIHVQRTLTRRGAAKVCECGHDREKHKRDGYGVCEVPGCDGCETYTSAKGWKLAEPKTSRARRVVVLPTFAVEALREWKPVQARERLQLGAEYQDHGFVFATEFGRPLDGANLYARNFNRIMAAAELGEWEEEEPKPEGQPGPTKARTFRPAFRMYDLRHTAATLLLRQGVNPKVVSERLGHASVAFTMDVYAASLPDLQHEAAAGLETMLGSG
ncbi:MAG: site-specific integrase [Gemmatimonadota bacterium]